MGFFMSTEPKKIKSKVSISFHNPINNNIGLQNKSMKFFRLLNISLAIFSPQSLCPLSFSPHEKYFR